MKRTKEHILLFLTSVCLVVMPALCCADAIENRSDKVLATVGDVKITEADLYSKVSMLPPQFRARYETPEGKKRLLDQTVKFTLLSREARRLGIDKKEDVARKIKEIVDNIIIQDLTKQEITDKIKVSDDDVKKYYSENKEKFVKPEKVKVRLIFFEAKEDASDALKNEKKKKAGEILGKIKKGADFEKLAKEVSEDKRTRKRNGNTGFFSKGKRKNTYGDKFEEIAFSLEAGKISDVFESKNGFYIVQFVEKKVEKQQSLDDVKNKIERKMKQEKQKEAYEKYLEVLKKKSPVKILEKSMK